MSDGGRMTMLASEAVLAKDWLTPEEDAAWAYLSLADSLGSTKASAAEPIVISGENNVQRPAG